jgi:fatty acid desaturase
VAVPAPVAGGRAGERRRRVTGEVLWVEVLVVFLVCHLVGDFLLQTDWQARHKRGGLGRDPVARRALLAHASTYTLAFVPALVWIATDDDIGPLLALGFGALVFVPHFVQDDGRVVTAWMRVVKRTDPAAVPGVTIVVDQTMHIVALFLLAIVVAVVA